MRRTLSVVLWVMWPTVVVGQVDFVVTAGGSPVPAVRVDVWGTAELLGTVSTDARGHSTVGADQWDRARRISLSHLGYQTLILSTSLIESGSAIALEPRATEIAGVSVLVDARGCPQPDDPEARRRWELARSGYSAQTGYQASFVRELRLEGSVREPELFDLPIERMRPTNSWRTEATWPTEPGTYPLLEGVVENAGYVWERGSSSNPRDLNWAYPRFEGRHAYHFGTDLFGRLHTFFMVRETEGRTTVGFCSAPQRSSLPSMHGTIVLDELEGLLSAEWRFASSDPDEGAGGEVLFASYPDSTGRESHLMAARGLFFRHNGKEPPYPDLPRDYYRSLHLYTAWSVGAGPG